MQQREENINKLRLDVFTALDDKESARDIPPGLPSTSSKSMTMFDVQKFLIQNSTMTPQQQSTRRMILGSSMSNPQELLLERSPDLESTLKSNQYLESTLTFAAGLEGEVPGQHETTQFNPIYASKNQFDNVGVIQSTGDFQPSRLNYQSAKFKITYSSQCVTNSAPETANNVNTKSGVIQFNEIGIQESVDHYSSTFSYSIARKPQQSDSELASRQLPKYEEECNLSSSEDESSNIEDKTIKLLTVRQLKSKEDSSRKNNDHSLEVTEGECSQEYPQGRTTNGLFGSMHTTDSIDFESLNLQDDGMAVDSSRNSFMAKAGIQQPFLKKVRQYHKSRLSLAVQGQSSDLGLQKHKKTVSFRSQGKKGLHSTFDEGSETIGPRMSMSFQQKRPKQDTKIQPVQALVTQRYKKHNVGFGLYHLLQKLSEQVECKINNSNKGDVKVLKKLSKLAIQIFKNNSDLQLLLSQTKEVNQLLVQAIQSAEQREVMTLIQRLQSISYQKYEQINNFDRLANKQQQLFE